MSDKYDKLEKLNKLRDQGIVTEEEFQLEKNNILADGSEVKPVRNGPTPYWGLEENVFCMLIHLSQLANFVVPFSGVILPIVMWATEKENSKKVDMHGRIVFNWLISSIIYFICSLILSIVFIGIFMLIALGIASVIFTILGGIKANEGKIWKYPMSIRFFSNSTP
tara:strand:- start:105 stop:602 length:498 start_codon:yes stop_codon:yes gene_type:complete